MARKKPAPERPANISSLDGQPAAGTEYQSILAEVREANERLVIAGVHMQELAEEARQREAEWNALLNSLTEGVIVVDAADRLVLANPVARQMLALAETGEPIAESEWVSIHPRDLGGRPLGPEARPLVRAIRGERFDDYEVLLTCRDGKVRRCAFNGSSIRDETGAVRLAIVTFRDLTEFRRLEQTKNDYIYLISHDLRAPLTAILGQAQLLSRVPDHLDREMIAPKVEAIIRSSRHMNRMIQELLDTARLEAGQTVLHPEPLDPRTVVAEAIDDVASVQDRPRIQIESIEPVPPMYADRLGVERVIMNIVGNALKFSPEGSPVEVDVRSSDGEVTISVTDHGAGIPPEVQPHLFEKFYRLTTGQGRDGIGLGLYISQLIVEASGGRIWATSQLGQGSTFSFSLPVAGA